MANFPYSPLNHAKPSRACTYFGSVSRRAGKWYSVDAGGVEACKVGNRDRSPRFVLGGEWVFCSGVCHARVERGESGVLKWWEWGVGFAYSGDLDFEWVVWQCRVMYGNGIWV